MPVKVTARYGDAVVYIPDTDLYGLMEVSEVRPDKRLVCRIDKMLTGRRCYEVFDRAEVAVVKQETTP